jgi:hypothetical protein
MIFKAASPPFLFQVYPETENMSMTYSHNTAILGRAAGEESSAGAQPILQKSFKGAWGQISPTSEKWLQATLLAKCEAGKVRTAARAAKRALFALLASPFSVLQRHPIFNRGSVHKMLLKPSCRQRHGLNAQCQ